MAKRKADDLAAVRCWLPRVSARTLEKVAAAVEARGDGGDASVKRNGLSKAKTRLLGDCIKQVRVEGTDLEAEVLDLQHVIPMWMNSSEDMMRLFGKAAEECPGPWRLVLGFDEFDPGKALGGFHMRKVMNLHMTFAEFGRAAGSQDRCWLTLHSART